MNCTTPQEKKLEAWLAEAMEMLHTMGGVIAVQAGQPDECTRNLLAKRAIKTMKDFDRRVAAAGLDNGYPEGIQP